MLAVAVASAFATFGSTWDLLTAMRRSGAAQTDHEREQALGGPLRFPMDRFDHYRNWLRPDDRYYLDVNASGFAHEFSLADVVAAVARFYLLPAVQVATPDEASVVLSWDRDPALLGLRYYEQHREGAQLVFVSRIAR